MARECHYCAQVKDCRPFGPKGEFVCFACAMETPERKRQTEASFKAQLDACGDVAVAGGESGPYPFNRNSRNPS